MTLASRLVLSMLLLAPLNAFAQEWSAAQKDVWASVEAYWAFDAQGKTKEFMEYFDADYAGWYNKNALPSSKNSSTKFISYDHKANKTVVYDIQPVAIKVHGQFAFVHYYYNRVLKNAEGKDESGGGRWTDILMKQGGKWVLIGDAGGPSSKN